MSKRYSLIMTDDVYDAILKIAASRGMSMGKYLNEIVGGLVKNELEQLEQDVKAGDQGNKEADKSDT